MRNRRYARLQCLRSPRTLLRTAMTEKRQPRKPSCKVCHRRKVRCDGQTPCGSCSRARRPFACEYSPDLTEEPVRVPRGSACTICRQRKRKCDGKLPCSTCKDTLQSDACQYRTKARSAKDDGSECHARPLDVDLQVRLHHPWAEDDRTATQSDNPSLVLLQPDPARPPCGVDHSIERYSLRTLFVDYCTHYGLVLSVEKREAIARGDTSGAVVHPIFIPVAQMMGYLLADLSTSAQWAHFRGQSAKETEQRLRVTNTLDDSSDGLDPLTAVQVHQTLAMYWCKKRDFHAFQVCLATAGGMAILLCQHVALGQEEEEGCSALAHMVFIEIMSLTFLPVDQKTRSDRIQEFHRCLTKQHNTLELNFVRAKSALLFTQSQELVTEWNKCEPGNVVGKEWTERCRIAANDIHNHLEVLNTLLRELVASGATQPHILVVKVSVISLLAALADMHAVLAPFLAMARREYCRIVEAVAVVTRTLSVEDHETCDFLEVCWEIASRDISEQPPTAKWRQYLDNLGLSSVGSTEVDSPLTGSPLTDSSLLDSPLPGSGLCLFGGQTTEAEAMFPLVM
ncbi:hypothetical protein C8R46DRAFT_1059011 [Mycena filopes]|nr:hypothetical protein C8R46DRAFT_1059011 [Mycena filopes]